jgi:hypothetical protein
MPKAKARKPRKKASTAVKVSDLESRKNPKGGKVTLSDINIMQTVGKATPKL